MNRWEQARAGTGQAVLISGEAGIGNHDCCSAARARRRGNPWRTWRAVADCPQGVAQQNTPLHAVVTLLKQMLQSEPGGTLLQQLQSLLDRLSLSEAVPLFASLLDLSAADRPPVPPMPPERQREQTLEALVALLLEMSEHETVVLVVEDLHWLDATSLTWLERLIDQTATAPLLLVMTIRLNTIDMPWGTHARVTQLTLGALSGAETGQLIQLVLGDRPLPPGLREQIASQTDGVPLFVEEMTRSVLDWGDSGERRELPTTLRESLTARLDRVGTAKEVAQLASVIGRVFSWKLLAAVASQNEDTLQRELRRLVQSGLVHQRGFGAQTRYSFKHALIRDAAYDSLLRKERQQVHLRIATAMDEGQRAGTDKVQSEEIAHHYMIGEQFDRAFECWLEAGQRAIGRSAHAEAIGHLRHALEALERQAPSAGRDEREISVQSALASSLGVTRGPSAPEVEAGWNRVLALTGQAGNVPGEIYFGLWNFYASRGQLAKARALGQERLDYGAANNDIPSLFLGLYTTAAADLFTGNLQSAREGFEKLLAMYPRDLPATQSNSYDMGIVTQSLLGDTLWHLGLADAATRMLGEATERGKKFSPFTYSIALVQRMAVSSSMRDDDTTRQVAKELIALSGALPPEFLAHLICRADRTQLRAPLQEQVDEGRVYHRRRRADRQQETVVREVQVEEHDDHRRAERPRPVRRPREVPQIRLAQHQLDVEERNTQLDQVRRAAAHGVFEALRVKKVRRHAGAHGDGQAHRNEHAQRRQLRRLELLPPKKEDAVAEDQSCIEEEPHVVGGLEQHAHVVLGQEAPHELPRHIATAGEHRHLEIFHLEDVADVEDIGHHPQQAADTVEEKLEPGVFLPVDPDDAAAH